MDLMTRLRDSLCDTIQIAVEDVISDYSNELDVKRDFKPLFNYIDELEKEQYIYSTVSNRTVQSITDDLIRLKKELLDD